MNEEFYLNRENNCVLIPKRYTHELIKENYLNEFLTQEEKELALFNLGIKSKLDLLKSLIDAKVILSGAIAWDLEPTLGNITNILSSDAIYQILQRYYTKSEVEELILELYHRFVEESKITVDDELTDTTNPVTGRSIKQVIDHLIELLSNEELSRLQGYSTLLGTDNDIKTDNTIKGLRVAIDYLSEQLHNISEVPENVGEQIQQLQSQLLLLQNSLILHIIITEEDYEALSEYNPNALYFILDSSEEWGFGDQFPITLT